MFNVLLQYVYWCHVLSARCVRSFRNKHILDISPFLSNNPRKMSNMRTGTEIVNPCIVEKFASFMKVFKTDWRSTLSEENIEALLCTKVEHPEIRIF